MDVFLIWLIVAYRKPKEELKVTIGALSLITPEPEEQIITILDMVVFDLYEEATQKHDIALIEVYRTYISLCSISSQAECF